MLRFNEFVKIEICESAGAGLAAKAKKSGISIGTLRKVYRRGVAAWNSGHRPGTTPQQWGMARVNSYITKGKGTYYGADKDLHEQKELDENRLSKIEEEMTLWKYNPVSGLWKSERTVTPETKDKWLEIFKKDDPKAKFIVSKNKPGTKAHLKEEDENRLSKVPKDKESGLPKKYVAGLSKSTAKARASHWKEKDKLSDSDPRAYEPAPGDATAKTKESKHTKKYRDMFGK